MRSSLLPKPCPRCGGSARLKSRRGKFWYECDGDCWTSTRKHTSRSAAAAEWNSLGKEEEPDNATY